MNKSIQTCYIPVSKKSAGITLELNNKRANTIEVNNSIQFNNTLTSINNYITYNDGTITFLLKGYYYVNYYVNVSPGTVVNDFSFLLTNTLLKACGSGANSGSPTSFCYTSGIIKVNQNDSTTLTYQNTLNLPILLGDTEVQSNLSILYLGTE